MKIPQPRTVPEIVKQFYGVISRPVRYASLFYTLYYLTEVENIRELRRDFENIRDELYVAFYNYGVYSVGREMRHFVNAFSISDEKGVYGSLEHWMLDAGKERALRKASNCLKNPLYMNYLETFMSYYPATAANDKTYENVERFCARIEQELLSFSRSKHFLNTCYNIFSLDGWDQDYGGDPWAKICKTLLRRNKTRPSIFVDACWNLQHKGGLWMNKVKTTTEEYNYSKSGIYHFTPLGLLMRILDSNMAGALNENFSIACDMEPSLVKYKEYFK